MALCETLEAICRDDPNRRVPVVIVIADGFEAQALQSELARLGAAGICIQALTGTVCAEVVARSVPDLAAMPGVAWIDVADERFALE